MIDALGDLDVIEAMITDGVIMFPTGGSPTCATSLQLPQANTGWRNPGTDQAAHEISRCEKETSICTR